MSSIETHSKLIASLADSLRDNMWATDILNRCDIIEEELRKLKQIAAARVAGGGER